MAETAGTISGSIEVKLDKLRADVNLAVNLVKQLSDKFKNNLTAAEKSAGTAFDKIAASIKNVDKEFIVFGQTTDGLRKKQKLIAKQIRALIQQGTDPQAKSIKKLKTEYDNLGREIDLTRQKISQQRKEQTGADKLSKQIRQVTEDIKTFGRSTELLRKQKKLLAQQIRSLISSGLNPQSQKVQSLKNQYDSLTREIKENSVATNRGGESLKRLTDFTKQFISTAAIILGVFVAIKKGITVFTEFEQSIKNVQAVTKATGIEFAILEKSAIEAGESTRFTASQAADALFFLSSAGLSARESVEALNGVLLLAGATGSDLAGTADTVTAVLSQFDLAAKESTRVANVFAAANQNSQATLDKLRNAFQQVGPVAAGLGLTLEETTGALQILFNAGFKGETAGRALKSALADLSAPSAKLTGVFKRLGIAVDEVNPKNNTFAEIIGRIRESGADTSDIIQAFGKVAGPQLAVLVKQGEDAINSYTEAVTATNAAAESYKIQNDSLKGSFDTLKSVAEGAAITFVREFSPGIREIIEVVKLLIQANTPLLKIIGFITNGLLKIISVPLKGFFTVFKEGADAIAGSGFSNELERIDKRIEGINETITKAQGFESQAKKINTLTDEYEKLTGTTNKTEAEQERLAIVVQELGELVPDAITATDKYNNVLEVNADRSREAALQILRSKAALLETARAQLEIEKPLLNNIIRRKKAEADRQKEERQALSVQARNAEERLALISKFEAEIDKRAGDAGDLVPIFNDLIGAFDSDFRRLGISLKTVNPAFEGIEQQFQKLATAGAKDEKVLKTLRKELDKEQKIVIEVEEAERKLESLTDTEKRLAIVTGQLNALEADPISDTAGDNINDLQQIANAFWTDFNSSVENATKQDRLLGDELDVLRSKMSFIATAVKDLSEKGFTPQGFTIQRLIELYNEAGGELESLTEKQKEQRAEQEKANKDTKEAEGIAEKYAKKLEEISGADEDLIEKERERALASLDGFTGTEEAANAATEAINQYFDALSDSTAAEEAAANQKKLFEDISSGFSGLVGSIVSLQDQLTQNKLNALDTELQAELEARGLAEETEIQRLEKELESAKESGDEIKIKEKQDALDRAKIVEEFNDKKEEIEFQGALKRWKLTRASTIAEGANAIVTAASSAAFPFNLPAIGFATGITAVNTAAVVAAKPQKFQTGGIVPGTPTNGDSVNALLTPGEAVFTRDDQAALLNFIRSGTGGGGDGGGLPAVLTIVLDSRLIASSTVKLVNAGEYTIDATRGLINADKL